MRNQGLGSAWLTLRVIFVFSVVAGCSQPSSLFQRQSPEATLTQQVQRLWKAKVAGDWESVYQMTDAKYRSSATLAEFIGKHKFSVASFSIQRIRMDEDAQAAHVLMIFEGMLLGQLRKVSVGERWVHEGGHWRLKLSDPVNIFQLPTQP